MRTCSRIVVMTSLLLWLAGCARVDIDVTYGKRRGYPGAESVNGTAVLASMFEQAGHRVTTWSRLSPKLQESQTIVWFPDSFAPPAPEQRHFLERWLAAGSNRTLVYVGRDYDAAIEYWKKIQPQVPPQQALEVARRLALAQAMHDRQRSLLPEGESFDWFVVHRNGGRRLVRSFTGAWAIGIDGGKTNIEIEGRYELPGDSHIEKWAAQTGFAFKERPLFERLLGSRGQTLAGRVTTKGQGTGQIVFVSNGSFLLNLPLANREHRKLAGKLIAACGAPGRVVFLESGKDGPAVYDQEPGDTAATGFEVFTVWPLGVILVHLTALGFLACITLFPIFGRPKELKPSSSADFGEHVTALGEMFEKIGDRNYARQRLRAYHELTRREPGHDPVRKR